jgi:hypothetical protein
VQAQVEFGGEDTPPPATPLAPSEKRLVHLNAATPENRTGIQVEPGVTLGLVVKEGHVCDWMNPAGPEGRPSGNNPLLHLTERRRVARGALWMEVVARVDGEDTVVGRGPLNVTSSRGGELLLLVNDVNGFYGNNRGGFMVEVTRP